MEDLHGILVESQKEADAHTKLSIIPEPPKPELPVQAQCQA